MSLNALNRLPSTCAASLTLLPGAIPRPVEVDEFVESTVGSQTAEGRGKQPVVNLIIITAEQHVEPIARGQRNSQIVGGEGQFLSQEKRVCLPANRLEFTDPRTARQIRAVEHAGLPRRAALHRPFRQSCNMLPAECAFRQRYQELDIIGFRAVGVVDDAFGRALEVRRRQIVAAEDHRGIFLPAGKCDTTSQLRDHGSD